MIAAAAPPTHPARLLPAMSRRQTAFDVLLGAVCLAVTLVVNLSGTESVIANRDPDALTVALTVLSVGSIVLRRRFPQTILALSLVGVLGLVW
jgi:hypothetical protein